MRTETEIYGLIIGIANADENIRAVYMNGSRTNTNAPKDIFQDYDIVYVVGDTKPYIEDKSWIDRFGERLYMQYPDEHPDFPSDKENFYGWLMQFVDGNRIDLHVESISHAKANIYLVKLCKVLLDKDDMFTDVSEATDVDYHVKCPTKEQFACICTEFWWCLNNVAKGLWRKEVSYVQDMLNFVVRKQLEKMLTWKIGIDTDFKVAVGKSGKYMHRWLLKEEYKSYLATYCGADIEVCWAAVFKMRDLFETTAWYVADKLSYQCNIDEAQKARAFLMEVKRLPENATEIKLNM